MRNAAVFLLTVVFLALGGCATKTTKTYADGEVAPVTVLPGGEQKKGRDVRYVSEKYSANLYDYKQAYALAYLEAQEQGAFAPDKPRLPLFEAGSSLVAVNTLGIALDAAGSSWASSLFSPGFLAGGIVLGLLTPQSEEKRFVQFANQDWKEIVNSTVRYVGITPLGSTDQAEINQQNEAWFEQANQVLSRAGVSCEFDPQKGEKVQQGYSRTMVKRCALLQEDKKSSMLVESSIAAPESNYTKKYGPVVVSRMSFHFGPGNDIQVMEAVAKLKPFIKENWISMYPGIDSSGRRRMFVGKGEDIAVFDLPPQPFSDVKEAKKNP